MIVQVAFVQVRGDKCLKNYRPTSRVQLHTEFSGTGAPGDFTG